MLYGAIIGDIVGSRFEFDKPNWSRDFDFFTKECKFTDDTLMTIAVAQGVVSAPIGATEDEFKENLIPYMRFYGITYPYAGYGMHFSQWFINPKPYNSFGNGSAMRVSSVGWLYESLEKTRKIARWTAEVSHNHPEGIKGAECTAAVIWMARNGYDKDRIMTYVVEEFGYDLSKTVDELIPMHRHDETCMDSLPKALTAFYEGANFEEVIRNAVAMGGDTDTIAAIAGSMAEAMYDIPSKMKNQCREILGNHLAHTLDVLEANGRLIKLINWKRNT